MLIKSAKDLKVYQKAYALAMEIKKAEVRGQRSAYANKVG
jgi:hypothetical protein